MTALICVNPEISYYLDCMSEFGDISPTEYAICHNKLVELSDIPDGPQFINTMLNRANALLATANDHTLRNMHQHLKVNLEYFQDRFVHTMSDKIRNVAEHRQGIKRRTLWSDLISSFELKMQELPEISHVEEQFVVQAANLIYGKEIARVNADIEWLSKPCTPQTLAIFRMHRCSAITEQQDIYLQWAETIWGRQGVSSSQGIHVRFDNQKIIKNRMVNKAKTAIKKVSRLFENLGEQQTLSMFVNNDAIELSHPDMPYKFVINNSHNIIERTLFSAHASPFKVSLFTKDGVYLSNLCVYVKDTPVLDQLLSFLLIIKSGEQEMLLEKANFYNIALENCRTLLESLPARLKETMEKYHLNTEASSKLAFNAELTFEELPEQAARDAKWATVQQQVRSWIKYHFIPSQRTMLVS